jgi:hypothetical protein
VEANTETPTAPAPELSIDEIVAAELKAADEAGTTVVQENADDTRGASEADGAHTAGPAGSTPVSATDDAEKGEPTGDEITAARARKILEKVESRTADLDAREARLAERENASGADLLAQLLKAPKATLAKFGKSIDDMIDASIAEGKETPTAATDDNPRLTELERRIEARERNEQARADQARIDARMAEIHRDVKASAKFPLVNETDSAAKVTDFMVEYHRLHGKAIGWDRAAALVEADLKAMVEKGATKLGFAKPATAPTSATAPKDRPGTTSIGGDQRTSTPIAPVEPEDPNDLMAFLVKEAQGELLKTA